MKVLIAGGYGFLGQKLLKDLSDSGYSVTVGGRRNADPVKSDGAGHLTADFTIPGDWQKEVAKFDVIINLVGVNIFQRWNPEVKKNIYDSRILSTRNIVDALKGSPGKKKIFINASAVGIYGDRGDDELDEASPAGDDFLSEVCRDWEQEALKASEAGMRVAILRFGSVLGRDGGAFPELKKTFRRFMGGKLGNGKQWFPWIHVDDVTGIIIRIIKNSKMSGIYNAVSPGVLTNKYFTDIMAAEVNRPVLIPFIPGGALKIVFGEFGGFLVKGQRTVPAKLIKEGYKFKYSDVGKAVKSLL
ncbi:MAG TPA: TIGR01777 family oxidoreductase [Spirochaetota bacterium]|nr:TIGR01777 family oxidoreductase [Spirochaetota bacterium]